MRISKFTARWFELADDDLRAAELLLNEGVAFHVVCFHAQQAAEKYLKGFLAFHKKRLRKIHQLDALTADCETIDSSFKALRDGAIFLTQFYIATRYPGDLPEFSKADAKKTVEIAKEVQNFVMKRIS